MSASHFLDIDGHRIAYREAGAGRPVLLLHGNPTSSFLWRNVIPHLSGQAQCLAPDLIGMGQSDKLPPSAPDRYRFVCHRHYLDRIIEAFALTEPVILVLHDWGSALGFDWARRHPDRVAGIAYMEAIVRPISWSEWPEQIQSLFQSFRTPAGEQMILDNNFFVEKILPGSILRKLTDQEMDAYREPFRHPGDDRLPTLVWPRELPIDGEPADVVAIVRDYADWLGTTEIPKLFINAEPGAILVGDQRETCRTWPNQQEITVPGIHFIQEDSADQIGAAISQWITAAL